MDISDTKYKYFTTWSLIISYSIFTYTLILGCPKWLFIFAMCFLTTTSIMGSFFITIPSAKIEANKNNTDIKYIIFLDFLTHGGPLILALLLFNTFSKKIINNKENILQLGKYNIVIKHHYKIILLSLIIIIIYINIIKLDKIYFYDYFTLIILSIAIFITSYQIYMNLLHDK